MGVGTLYDVSRDGICFSSKNLKAGWGNTCVASVQRPGLRRHALWGGQTEAERTYGWNLLVPETLDRSNKGLDRGRDQSPRSIDSGMGRCVWQKKDKALGKI